MSELYRIPQNPIHFPNLNGLRFLAALMVIVHHVEQMRKVLHLPNHWDNGIIQLIGSQGVTLFFVLSGFLITYLLLVEREQFEHLAIKKFYLRRVLRIWPLYYAVVALGLLIMPHVSFFYVPGWAEHALENIPQKAALFGLVVPNIALVLYGAVPYLSQAWSIGTEEQFYLFWPWLVQWAGKKILLVLISTALFFLAIRFLIKIWHDAAGQDSGPVLGFCYDFLQLFRIECMVIGAIFAAILYSRRDYLLKWLMGRATQWTALAAIIGLLASGRFLPFQQVIYALLFAIFILNQAAAKRPVLWMENRWFNFLGKISYGLYMLHIVAIVVVLRTIAPWLDAEVRSEVGSWLLTDGAVLGLTVALASASYYGLEKPFLRLKVTFSRIHSQPDVTLTSEKMHDEIQLNTR